MASTHCTLKIQSSLCPYISFISTTITAISSPHHPNDTVLVLGPTSKVQLSDFLDGIFWGALEIIRRIVGVLSFFAHSLMRPIIIRVRKSILFWHLYECFVLTLQDFGVVQLFLQLWESNMCPFLRIAQGSWLNIFSGSRKIYNRVLRSFIQAGKVVHL